MRIAEYSFLSTLLSLHFYIVCPLCMYYFYICIQLCCIQWSAVPPVLLSCCCWESQEHKKEPAAAYRTYYYAATTHNHNHYIDNINQVYECYTYYTLTKNTAISSVTAMIAAMLVPPHHSSYSCYDCGWSWLPHTPTAIGYDCYATLVQSNLLQELLFIIITTITATSINIPPPPQL